MENENTEKISIIIPVYNEEENVNPVYDKIKEAFGTLNYELVFIDDGSSDHTWNILETISRSDFRVKAISFQSNYGKAAAYSAGFSMASGDIITTMDGDMQDDPRDLLALIEKLHEGYDAVIGWKYTGKSSWFKYVLSNVFNFFIRIIAKSAIKDLNCPLRAFRREVAKRLNIYGDLHRYIPLLVSSEGYKITQVKVSNYPRIHGKSKYTSKKYLNSFFDFISIYYSIKYSTKPLHFFGKIGLLSFGIGCIIDLWLSVRFFMGGTKIDEDLPTLILGVLLIILGSLFFSIGLLGEIQLRNIYSMNPETKYSIRKILNHEAGKG